MVSHSRHPQSSEGLAARLAHLYGVQTTYRDTWGRWQQSPLESVALVLRALGAEVDPFTLGLGSRGPAAVRAAIQAREAQLAKRLVEPVLVAWDGKLPSAEVPRAAAEAGEAGGPARSGGRRRLTLLLEGGEELRWETEGNRWRGLSPVAGLGRPTAARLPFGYHVLAVESGSRAEEATVISAPRECWQPERGWGLFAPAYALHSERDWGAGDLADLGRLCEQVGYREGSIVATLPLLASFLGDPFEPAPYRPVSRMFWNEFYLPLEQLPEWQRCESVRAMAGSRPVQQRLRELRAAHVVDYRGVMSLKKQLLDEAASCFFRDGDAERRRTFAEYLETHPEAATYAAFRANEEPAGRQRAAERHLYSQWQMESQLARVSGGDMPGAEEGRGAAAGAAGLMLDLPVGVHPQGFDTWRWPQLFALEMSIGAPPDTFFAGGQSWATPPLHPAAIREDGHRYFAGCIRHHMRHARYLRIDHVMSLHRLFWIPEGGGPADGVYVDYPAEELYAVLCLESHRHETAVVGEDLGTVPPGVRAAMRRHGLLGTWVLQSALRPRRPRPVEAIPARVVAGLGTHDMFPLLGFLHGDDIDARLGTGQIDRAGARREHAARRRLADRVAGFLQPPAEEEEATGRHRATEPPGPAAHAREPSAAAATSAGESDVMRGAVRYLAESEAPLVVVNLEDLLLETRPQNIPGTGEGAGNWQRKIGASEDEVKQVIGEAAGWLARR